MKMSASLIFFTLVAVIVIETSLAIPKKYQSEQEGGFEPSHRYYETNLPNNYRQHNESKITERKNYDKSSKFGVIPIGSYGGSGVGDYGTTNGNVAYSISPVKIDLAGVALGALIGLGAILILPKITNILGGGHGGYRTLESEGTLPEIFSRIDNILQQNEIDSNSCIQRVVCSYVNNAKKNQESGQANDVDDFIMAVSNNNILINMMYGAGLKQAVDVGKSQNEEQCSTFFSKCSLSNEKVMKVISNFLPN